jgi:hypothetical protein
MEEGYIVHVFNVEYKIILAIRPTVKNQTWLNALTFLAIEKAVFLNTLLISLPCSCPLN